MKFIIKTLLTAIAVMIAAYLLPGIRVDSFLTALLVAFTLSILNAIVRPILMFVSIPATVLTLGLFIFAINAVLVILAYKILGYFHVNSFQVDGFWWALLFSLIVSFFSSIFNSTIKKDENPKQLKD